MALTRSRRLRAPSTGAEHLERTSVYLILTAGAAGGLGTVFWLVAARLADESDVGAAVAASSLLIAAAFLSQLNVATALSRYLPAAGRHQGALVQRAYRVTVLASVLVGGLLIGIGLLRGGAIVDGGNLVLTLSLGLSVPVWVVFGLQDDILVTLRESRWIPLENVATTVAKFAILPLLVGVTGGGGILLAWTVPLVVAIVAVNAYLYRSVLPRLQAQTPESLLASAEIPGVGRFLSYALRDFPGAALQMLSLRLVPLLVLELGEPADGAYVGLPWTILTVAALVLAMLSRALLAELSQFDASIDELMRRTNRRILFGLLPAAFVGALFVGPVLSIAGSEYAARGTWILAAGVVGLVPAAFVECRLALLRFRLHVAWSGIFQSVQAVVMFAVSYVLVVVDQVQQLGLGFLVVSVVSALAVNPVAGLVERRSHADRVEPAAHG